MSGPFVDQATDSKRWYLADISRPDGTFNDALPKSPFIYHRSSLAGKGITIHVLDSGCNMDATELPLARVSEVELRPDDLKSGILEATKARLHGTTVASLAAGTTNGVAPAAQVKVWRVVHVDVQADEPIALWAAAAFGKIVEANKAESHLHVINCSFGALSPNNLTAPTLLLLRSAVEKAITAGFLVVVAAGNSAQEIRFPNPNDKPSQNKPANDVVYPACIAGVLTVGAYDYVNTRDKASFSNSGAPVKIWAPGTKMPKMDAAKSEGQGTSYAAPVVAGVAACILAEHQRERLGKLASKPPQPAPTLKPKDLIDRILSLSDTASDQRKLIKWGPMI